MQSPVQRHFLLRKMVRQGVGEILEFSEVPRVCLLTPSLFRKHVAFRAYVTRFLKFSRSTSVLNVQVKPRCDGMFDAPDQILR